ncbi:MAG: carbohydrate kinase [Spirochaetales bacterium]|nr:carbohydrate kinase [Spirochaetales bacterium]
MKNYYMGIDNGGTLCKAVIFDREGREIASGSCKLDLETPAPGRTERDMEYLWQSNIKAIKSALEKSGLPGEAIKGIACSGHGKGLYLWGKEDEPAYRGIVSTDSRAWEYPLRWKKDGTADKAFEKTCQDVLASQPVSLLNWLRDNEPGVVESTRWIFEVKDYIRFRLTGEAFAEVTDYSGSSMMNLVTKSFDPDLLKLFGLEDCYDKLPPLKKSTDFCGSLTKETAALTGLKEGTPVGGGMFDIDACAIAMDITDDKNICVIAGTWSINEYISREPVLNRSIMMNSLYCHDGYYLVEECSPTSAGNLEWFVEEFLDREKREAEERGVNIFAYCDELVQTVTPEETRLLFLPYIFGSNYNPNAKSCFVGMDRSQSGAHRIRAVFEGIVFSHMIHLEKLLMNRESTAALRLAGGAANSRVWAQMFSDVSGIPVETIDTKELGALGVAMAAAVAGGEYADLGEAARTMVRIKEKIQPDPALKGIYDRKFRRYKAVAEALDPLWADMVRE